MSNQITARQLTIEDMQRLARGEKINPRPVVTRELPGLEDSSAVMSPPPVNRAPPQGIDLGKIVPDLQGLAGGNPNINVPDFPAPQQADRHAPTAQEMMGLPDESEDDAPPEMDVKFKRRTPKTQAARPSAPEKSDRANERRSPKVNREVTTLHERWDPPSRCLFYSWSEVFVRRLVLDDLILLNRALSRNDTTLLLDALGATTTQDIRELTIPDFRHLMFWHRLNSYIKSPYTVNWISQYGNKNETLIKSSSLIEKELEMSEEDVMAWRDRGFTVPTCRDLEIFETAKMDEDTTFLFNRAQWLSLDGLEDEIERLRIRKDPTPTLTARINRLRNGDIGILEDVRDFRESLGDYGVTEVIKVTDAHFDAEKWLGQLRVDLDALQKAAELSPDLDFTTEINLLEVEVREAEAKKARGETITAKEEEVPLSFNAWNLFPGV